jgi:thioesterase domain-containing protein/acyl carrier protein
LNMPPPVFRNIFGNMPEGEKFPSVRLILLGGDTMISRDVEIFQQHFSPSCHLLNYLGLTEMGIATRYFIDPQVDSGPNIPVGYPFEGVEISIVSEDGTPLPPGGEGELVIKTSYLTRDPRLNRESMDDNRFTTDPQTGWCTVLSGDLGRIREDGALEHLGRKDTVVKIRGLRIDTAEVEAMLCMHESVQDAAVSARGTENLGELQIVAYVVPKLSSDLTIAQLYGFLSWKLPQYMIPSRFVFLDKLPLSSNGKIDRNQLPEPDWNQPVLGDKFISPRNSIEWQLAGIWSDLLKIKRIGIHDNFFTLGGHSLMALQLLERVEKDMKVKLPMQTLAKHATLAGVAGLIEELSPITIRSSITLLREGEEKPALFIVPGGARSGISLMNIASRITPGHKVYALEYPGMDGYLDPLDDIGFLADFFNQQILSVQPEGPYHVAGPCLGGVIVFEMAQQLLEAGKKVGLLALLDSTPPGGESTWAAKKRTSQYYRNRAAAIMKTRNLNAYLGSLKTRLRRNKFFLTVDSLWKRLRYNFHKTDEQLWQDRRLDKQTWFVFDKLQLAKKSYLPQKYPGKAVVLFNAVSEGTPREKQWRDLLGECDVYYIPGTSHGNIFSADTSVDRLAAILNQYLRDWNHPVI